MTMAGDTVGEFQPAVRRLADDTVHRAQPTRCLGTGVVAPLGRECPLTVATGGLT